MDLQLCGLSLLLALLGVSGIAHGAGLIRDEGAREHYVRVRNQPIGPFFRGYDETLEGVHRKRWRLGIPNILAGSVAVVMAIVTFLVALGVIPRDL